MGIMKHAFEAFWHRSGFLASSGAMVQEGGPQEGDALCGLLAAWKESAETVRLGTTGVMANVTTKKELGRRDVCRNAPVLCPVVEHLGA